MIDIFFKDGREHLLVFINTQGVVCSADDHWAYYGRIENKFGEKFWYVFSPHFKMKPQPINERDLPEAVKLVAMLE